VRRGRRTVWRTGIAQVLPDDDPLARQRQLARRDSIVDSTPSSCGPWAPSWPPGESTWTPDASRAQTIATDDPEHSGLGAVTRLLFIGHPEARLRAVGTLAARPTRSFRAAGSRRSRSSRRRSLNRRSWASSRPTHVGTSRRSASWDANTRPARPHPAEGVGSQDMSPLPTRREPGRSDRDARLVRSLDE
jgi:hypothetical protein